MKIHTGGPAFPARVPLVHDEAQGKDYPCFDEAGMSLRDYLAGQALVGVSTTPSAYGCSSSQEIADQAYKIADAMLRARAA